MQNARWTGRKSYPGSTGFTHLFNSLQFTEIVGGTWVGVQGSKFNVQSLLRIRVRGILTGF